MIGLPIQNNIAINALFPLFDFFELKETDHIRRKINGKKKEFT